MTTETLFANWKAGTLTEEMVREYYSGTEICFINISPDGVSVCIAATNSRELDYWEEVFNHSN